MYCSVEGCGTELSRETKTIEKTAHTPADAVRENEVAATCIAEGSYDEVVYCSVEGCGAELSRETKTIEKTAHTPGEAVRENEVAATCYAEGSYDEVVYCSVEECKHEISRTAKTIEKTAHTPAEAVRENEVAATCIAEGSYDEVVYCSVEECKHEISRTAKTIEKAEHVWNEGVYTAPTFEADGYTTYTCTTDGCGVTKVVTAEGTKLVAVAEVNGTKYTTLTEAVNAAPEGGTVTLLADSEEAVTVSKALTIAKNGYTANVTASDGFEKKDEEDAYRFITKETDVDATVLTSYGKSLLFEDIIRIKYYFSYLADEYSSDYIEANGGILVWSTEQEVYTPGTETYKVEGLTKSGSYYYAVGNGIPAKQWGELQYACAYLKNKDGSYSYSEVSSYSPLTYANNMLGKTTTKESLKTLLKTMLNYGAAAQVNFGYNTNNLMNSGLSADDQAWVWDESLLIARIEVDSSKIGFTYDSNVSYYGWSLVYEGAIAMKMYNFIDESLVSGAKEMGLLYWDEATYLNSESLTEGNAAGKIVGLTKSGSYYYGTIEGTPAKYLGKTCFACAYVIDQNGDVHFGEVRSYSAHRYAMNTINGNKTEALKNLCKTMVIYSDAAAKHFG